MPSTHIAPATRKYIKDRRSELRQLAEILGGTGVVRSVDPLSDAVVTKGDAPSEWRLAMNELFFDLDPKAVRAQRNAKPSDLAAISLTLSVGLRGLCLDRGALRDPFVKLAVECVVTGYRKGTDEDYHSAWHLDRDEPRDGRADLVHPAYHVQYGGQRLPALRSLGNHLLLGSPRIAHPPLDGVLAVDFVLTNYFPERWRDLRDDRRYRGLVGDAQDRYWRPYSMASAERWSAGDPAWDGEPVWPQVVNRRQL